MHENLFMRIASQNLIHTKVIHDKKCMIINTWVFMHDNWCQKIVCCMIIDTWELIHKFRYMRIDTSFKIAVLIV